MRQRRFVGERKGFRVGFQEKVEGIDDGHLRDQIQLDGKVAHAFREHHASQVIALRVLLPVEEVRLRLDLQRIRGYGSAAVGRGPEANHLRGEVDEAIVMINGSMMQSDAYRHER